MKSRFCLMFTALVMLAACTTPTPLPPAPSATPSFLPVLIPTVTLPANATALALPSPGAVISPALASPSGFRFFSLASSAGPMQFSTSDSGTLKMAEEAVGFQVMQPVWLPPGYSREAEGAGGGGITYNAQAKVVSLQYYAIWGTRTYVHLRLAQQSKDQPAAAKLFDTLPVEAGAAVRVVKIAGQDGEYFASTLSAATTQQAEAAGVTINQQASPQGDDPSKPSFAVLRWETDRFYFQIWFYGPCWNYLCGDADTLVKIAANMQ